MVCVVVLQNNNLGSIPTSYNSRTSLALVSLMENTFFLHKQSLPPLQVLTLRLGIKFGLDIKQLKNCLTQYHSSHDTICLGCTAQLHNCLMRYHFKFENKGWTEENKEGPNGTTCVPPFCAASCKNP